MVTLLLDHSADTRAKNFDNVSPHDLVFELDCEEKLRTLILSHSEIKKDKGQTKKNMAKSKVASSAGFVPILPKPS